jgi:endoglucanase
MYYLDPTSTDFWIDSCNVENIRKNLPNITNVWVLIRKKDSTNINVIDIKKNIIFMRNKVVKTIQGNNFITSGQPTDNTLARIKFVIINYNSIDMNNKILNFTLKTSAQIELSDIVFFNVIDNKTINTSFTSQKSISENGKTIISATMCDTENLGVIVVNGNDKNLSGEYELSIQLDNIELDFTIIPLEEYTVTSENIVANKAELDRLKDELGFVKYNIGISLLTQRIYNSVNKYTLTNGYNINGVTKTTQEIFDWFIDKDNCKTHGKLHKDGQYLKDSNGNIVELRGVCLMHIPTLVDKLHTYNVLKTLKYYGVNLVRLPALSNYIVSASIDKYDKSCYGYKNNKEEIKNGMDKIIEWCEELGLYVVLDYHFLERDGDLANYKADAVDFFTYFSNKYKDSPNVLYEIVNEPFGATVSTYLDFVSSVRNAIKSNVIDPIMIVGSTGGSSLAGNVTLANAGITDVFYSVHNYTGNGQDETLYINLYNAGYPLFITEWGNSEYSGTNNGKDEVAIKTLDFFHQNKIPNIVFQLSAIEATCSLLKYNDEINYFYKYGGFNYEDLTANGKLFFDKFFNYAFENI